MRLLAPRWVEQVRTAVAFGAVLAVGSLAIGCGKTATPATTTDTKPTLSVWYTTFREDTVKSIVDGIQPENSTLVSRRFPFETFETRSIDAIAADEAPDVWLIPNDWIPDHLNKIVTIPDDFWNDQAAGGPASTTAHFKEQYPAFVTKDLVGDNNRSVGFPGSAQTLVLYQNTSLFSKTNEEWNQANPDATEEQINKVQQALTTDLVTWDDFVRAASMITKRNGTTIVRSAAALGTASNVAYANDIVQLMIFQQGGSVVDSVKRVSLFNNYEKKPDGQTYYPGKDAFTFYLSFSNPSSPNYTWNTSMGDSRQAFLDGKVAMLIDYPEFEDVILQKKVDIEYRTTPVPQVYKDKDQANFARYYVAAVSKASKNQRLAATLAKKVAVESGQSLANGWPGSSPLQKENLADDISARQLATAKTVYKRHHALFDQTFSEMIDDVAVRGQTIDNALNRGAEHITNILQSE